MPWPVRLQLPPDPIWTWNVDLLAEGDIAPGASRHLPTACFYAPHQPPWFGGRRAAGDGALSALFRLDVDDPIQLMGFLRAYSGIRWTGGWELLEDWEPGNELVIPPFMSAPGHWDDLVSSTESLNPGPAPAGGWRRMTALFWHELRRLTQAFRPWEPLMRPIIGRRFMSQEEAELAIEELTGEYRGRGTVVPVASVAHDLRALRLNVIVTFAVSMTEIDTTFRDRLTTAAVDLLGGDDIPEDGIFGEPDWVQLLLPHMAATAGAVASATFKEYQPYIIPPDGLRVGRSVRDYIWVTTFNDLNDGFVPKICANPDCAAPFTRQVGQSRYGQSRRDARACSKVCADRITYLKRRRVTDTLET